MNKLSDIVKKKDDNRLPRTNEEIYNNSLNEFMKKIDSYSDYDDFVEIIEYDKKNYLLPYDVCIAIFNRLDKLGQRTSYILNWYSFILRFYGDPSDYEKADSYEREAIELEKQKKNN